MDILLVWVIAGVVVIVMGVLVYLYRRDKRAALASYRAVTTVADTTVGPVEYRVKGEVPTLLFMHGGAKQASMILNMVASGLDELYVLYTTL